MNIEWGRRGDDVDPKEDMKGIEQEQGNL